MTPSEKIVLDHLRASVERYLQLADVHERFGEWQKAEDCRALAALQDERSRKVMSRRSAA